MFGLFGWLRVLASRIGGWFTRRRLDEDFEQELDSHLALLTEENIRRGMTLEEARRAARLRLELDPKFAPPLEDLGYAYEQKGVYERAIAEFKKGGTFRGRHAIYGITCARARAGGKRSEAIRVLRELKHLSRKKYVPPYALALASVGLGKIDEAFDWLEKAYQERSSALPSLKVNPRLAHLHSDSRFQDLLRRIGLPP